MNDQSRPAPQRQQQWIVIALCFALVALSMTLRLRELDRFVTPDELKWVCRSINFYRGLRTGHLDETRQTGHPGVITMWLGVPFAGVDATDPRWEICRNLSLSDLIESTPQGTAGELAALLFSARRAVAILTSIAIGLAFVLLWRLFDIEIATVAGLLLTFDPFFLAHSRLLHLDAVTTSLLFLAILLLLLALEGRRRWLLAISGIIGALAALNKSPALFLGPFAGLVMLLYCVTEHRCFAWLVRTALLWGLPLLLSYVLLWPSMWVQPLETLRLVFGTALFYASNPHTNSNFFMGAPRPDPGLLFYPVALLFRLTPWSLLGTIAAATWLVLRNKRRRVLWTLTAFIILYGALMTMGQKKFDRYLLPVFPFIEVLAAVGLVGGARWLWHRASIPHRSPLATVALVLAITTLSLATIIPQAPYYLSYYNPLMGGGQAAIKTLLVGWGEGLDQAARFLNRMPNADARTASSRALPGFAAFYRGTAYDEGDYDPATTDYVVVYLNDAQRRLSPEILTRFYDVAEPLHTVTLNGIDYAWVYENQTHAPLEDYLRAHAKPRTDAIIVSRPSRFETHYAGPLPVHVIQPDLSHDGILHQLDALSQTVERVWYIRYAERNPNPTLEWLDYQWNTRTFALDSQSFTDVDLALRQTKGGVAFGASACQEQAVDLQFGDALRLQRMALDTPTAQWGRHLGVSLAWQAQRDPDRYYAEYIHLVDEAGHRWGQGDRWMVDESLRPTVDWRTSQMVADQIAVELVPGIPPGEYRLLLGVYDRVSGERLAVKGSGGQMLGERCEIGRVRVLPSPLKATRADLLVPHPVEREVAPGLALLGWDMAPAAPGFGQRATVSLYWQASGRMSEDYSARVRLLDEKGEAWAEGLAPIASTTYRTSLWPQGETLWHMIQLDVAHDAPATDVDLELTLLDGKGRPIAEPIALERLWLEGHYSAPPAIAHPQLASIGEHIQFLGYDTQPPEIKPGSMVHLTLYWSTDSQLEASYTVFTHLLDPSGTVRGQQDSVPLSGRYPLPSWRTDEVIVDRYVLQLADDAPGGEYSIEIGMYDPAANAARIPLYGPDGARKPDDRLVLDTRISVQP